MRRVATLTVATCIYLLNKEIVDIKFRPQSGAALLGASLSTRHGVKSMLLFIQSLAYFWPLCANMTSSIKPKELNISQRRQRRTEPRTYVTCKQFREDGTCSSGDMIADRQTDEQTDRHGHHNTLLTRQSGAE